MKGQKRPKLSLKRKQSILPGPSEAETNITSINPFTSRSKKPPVIANGNSPNLVSLVNTNSTSLCDQGNDGRKIVISISDDDDEKTAGKKARHSSGTEERFRDSKKNDQCVVGRCRFLDVENQDLRKLRESFLNYRHTKAVDIKSLRDLPVNQVVKTENKSNSKGIQNPLNNENVSKTNDKSTNQNDINGDSITNVHSLSLLPSLCKWCQYRKPVSLYDRYPYKTFWNYDENLPRDSSSVCDKFQCTDQLMKTEVFKNTEKKEIHFRKTETSRLNIGEYIDERQPLFENNNSSSTLNYSNVTEKMDVSDHSNIGRIVTQTENEHQTHESVNEILKQKNMDTNKSYNVSRQTSNADMNLVSKQNMENIDDSKSEMDLSYFPEGRRRQDKITRPTDETRKLSSADIKSNDSCNDKRKSEDNGNRLDNDEVNTCNNVLDSSNLDEERSSGLETCPLCQTKFEKGMKQIDKDGHIAACFAASSDDVSW